MSSRATNRSRQTRTRNRSPETEADAQRLSLPAGGAPDRPSTRSPGAAAEPDRPTLERELKRLRWVSRLLGLSLVTVLIRTVIDGPTLLSDLTAVLVLALFLASLCLWQWGRRLRRSRGPGSDQGGTTSDRQPNKEL